MAQGILPDGASGIGGNNGVVDHRKTIVVLAQQTVKLPVPRRVAGVLHNSNKPVVTDELNDSTIDLQPGDWSVLEWEDMNKFRIAFQEHAFNLPREKRAHLTRYLRSLVLLKRPKCDFDFLSDFFDQNGCTLAMLLKEYGWSDLISNIRAIRPINDLDRLDYIQEMSRFAWRTENRALIVALRTVRAENDINAIYAMPNRAQANASGTLLTSLAYAYYDEEYPNIKLTLLWFIENVFSHPEIDMEWGNASERGLEAIAMGMNDVDMLRRIAIHHLGRVPMEGDPNDITKWSLLAMDEDTTPVSGSEVVKEKVKALLSWLSWRRVGEKIDTTA